MPKPKIMLIVNPVAGKKKAKSILNLIIEGFRRKNFDTTVFTTSAKGDAIDIVKEFACNYNRVVCCGGDGTINEVITGLARAKLTIPVGYIPTGTTNDLAISLKLPTKTSEAIDVASDINVKSHDIGIINGNHFFSYVASFGAFTKAAYVTPQWLKNLFGRFAYIFKGIFCVTDIRPYKINIIADGKNFSGEYIFGSVSNTTSIGGILKYADSEVSFNDGMFEVLLVKCPANHKELFDIINNIINRHYNNEYMHYFKASELFFYFDRLADWTIDGEHAGAMYSVAIKNHSHSVLIAMS